MRLIGGVHHVATVTPDLDGLVAFYQTVFDTPVVFDVTEETFRHALVDVGHGAFLHVFQPAATAELPPPGPKLARGRLDHVAFAAKSREAFLDARGRLVAMGASDGQVWDYGMLWSLKFRDPDGWESEIVWTCGDEPFPSAPSYADVRPITDDWI